MTAIDYLHHLLDEQDLDALIISSPHHIRYLTHFFGFSVNERDAFVILTKDAQFIITNPLYSEGVRSTVKDFTLLVTDSSTPFTNHLTKIVEKYSIKSVGFEDENITVKEFVSFQKVIKKLIPITFSDLRTIKTQEEISAIERACKIGDSALAELLPLIKPGMTEMQIARELELLIKKKNADLSFPTIVAFGENAAIPHHHAGEKRLKERDLIFIDFGVLYDNYCSDMTRTFFMGEPTKEQEKAYNSVKLSQEKAATFIQEKLKMNKKINAKDVDAISREFLVKEGFPPIPHSLGHGIGLEVHESPSLSPRSHDILDEGMVFSIEPGVYLPGLFGIRIEDLYSIQQGRLIKLTQSPSDIIIL